jgi:exonuclease SbcD
VKLLCFGDLHLGQGGQYPGRLDDQRDVLGRIAGIAVEHAVDGVLFAGDAFEGPAVPPEQLAAFADFVDALHQLGIPILAITGNGKHDAAVRDTNGMAIFDHVPGIEVCSQPGVHLFAGCSVAVLPWVHPGRLIARAGGDVPRDELNRVAADLLVDVARDLLDTRTSMTPTILLGHWSVSGSALPAGLPVDDLREPVLPIEALEHLGYDALVFGHIHRAQEIGSNGFYTGSPMPLNFGEEHVEHGCWILDLGASSTEFVPIDSPRFLTIVSSGNVLATAGPRVDLCLFDDDSEIADSIVRVRYEATSDEARRIDVAQIRTCLRDAGARVVKIEPQIVREQRARVVMDEQLDELAALEMWLKAVGYAGDHDALRERARDLLEAVA